MFQPYIDSVKEARLDKHLQRLLQKVELIEKKVNSVEDRSFHESVQDTMQVVESGSRNVEALIWILAEKYGRHFVYPKNGI